MHTHTHTHTHRVICHMSGQWDWRKVFWKEKGFQERFNWQRLNDRQETGSWLQIAKLRAYICFFTGPFGAVSSLAFLHLFLHGVLSVLLWHSLCCARSLTSTSEPHHQHRNRTNLTWCPAHGHWSPWWSRGHGVVLWNIVGQTPLSGPRHLQGTRKAISDIRHGDSPSVRHQCGFPTYVWSTIQTNNRHQSVSNGQSSTMLPQAADMMHSQWIHTGTAAAASAQELGN